MVERKPLKKRTIYKMEETSFPQFDKLFVSKIYYKFWQFHHKTQIFNYKTER